MVVPVSSVSARIRRTAFTDHVFDLVRADLDGMDTRRRISRISPRAASVDRLFHHARDVQTHAAGSLLSPSLW